MENKLPTYDKIMLPLLKLISDEKTYTNKEAEEKLGNFFNLSIEELQITLPNGRRKFYDRINWAKTYLKKADLIVSGSSRGEFKITKEGLELLSKNIKTLDAKYLEKNYSNFSKFYKSSSKNKIDSENIIESNSNTPMESLDESFNILERELKTNLLEKIKTMDWYKFEKMVIDLIIKMGYGGSKTEILNSLTKQSNDEGIDGIINEDRLGLDRIYLQAKRWKDTTISRPEIQKFVGALAGQGATKGIFITTSNFSIQAIDYCKKLSNQKIILINGEKLTELMIEFNVGTFIEQTYEIKKIDMDYFSEE